MVITFQPLFSSQQFTTVLLLFLSMRRDPLLLLKGLRILYLEHSTLVQQVKVYDTLHQTIIVSGVRLIRLFFEYFEKKISRQKKNSVFIYQNVLS